MTAEPIALVPQWRAAQWVRRRIRRLREWRADWILILSRGHLERVLDVYVDHYNGHRPHRALKLVAPARPHQPFVSSTRGLTVPFTDASC